MNLERKQRCCFTGHRILSKSDSAYAAQRLKRVLKEKIESGCCSFLAGGAIGFDTIAAQTVLELRNQYPHIRLELILPFKGQEERWNRTQQAAYRDIILKADTVEYLCEGYMTLAYHARNKALIDRSSCCICFMKSDRRSGGTSQTVDMAKEASLEIINIAEPFNSSQ